MVPTRRGCDPQLPINLSYEENQVYGRDRRSQLVNQLIPRFMHKEMTKGGHCRIMPVVGAVAVADKQAKVSIAGGRVQVAVAVAVEAPAVAAAVAVAVAVVVLVVFDVVVVSSTSCT